jgi:hypothetical protein
MGKDKDKLKSHRSKQLPASSSQAAALFAQQPTGFVGFSAFSTAENTLGVLEGEYALAFKAMNKKDPTTKVKAIQEFIALLNAKPPSSDSSTNAILTQWDTLYMKLSDDSEWRVRLQAQFAMKCVAQLVKKQIAPHLKALLPVWTRALFDVHSDVSEAAHDALRVYILYLPQTSTFIRQPFPHTSTRTHLYLARMSCFIILRSALCKRSKR